VFDDCRFTACVHRVVEDGIAEQDDVPVASHPIILGSWVAG
jgi:hypothetical protein